MAQAIPKMECWESDPIKLVASVNIGDCEEYRSNKEIAAPNELC